jgi:type II secretory pathway pseudopilin PulG
MKNRRSGFTMIEMLVVVSLIIAMSTLAVGAFGAFLASKKIRLATRTVSNALRTARQYAVSNRLPCMVEFVDVDQDQDGDNDDDRDYLVITPFVAVVDPNTGELTYVLSIGPPLFRKDLPKKIRYTQIPPSLYADGTPVSIQINQRLNDGSYEKRELITAFFFLPNGSARAATLPATDPLPDNTIAMEDTSSKEESRVYCYPVTGYTREFYDENN